MTETAMTSEASSAPASDAPATESSETVRDSLSKAFDNIGLEHRKDEEREPVERPKRELTGRDKSDMAAAADRDALRSSLKERLEPVFDQKKAYDNWGSTRELCQTLAQRYPGAELGKLFGAFEQVSDALLTDPVAAGEQLRRFYLSGRLYGWDNLSGPKQYADGLRGSIDRGFDDADLMAQVQPFIDKYGSRFHFLLQRVVNLDSAMNEDAEGTVARLLAVNGQPITEQQVAERDQAAVHEQNVQQHEALLHNMIGNGIAPELSDPETAEVVANLLENPAFPWSGEPTIDVMRATASAREWLLQRHQEEKRAATREKAGKALTGSPGTGAVTQSSKTPSTREALVRALAGGV